MISGYTESQKGRIEMSRKEIPAFVSIQCDGCGCNCTEENYSRKGILTLGAYEMRLDGDATSFTSTNWLKIQRDYCDMCLSKIEWAISNTVVTCYNDRKLRMELAANQDIKESD
jgi:hypothetical protein